MTCTAHNSLTAIAEWVRRCDQSMLARLGSPFDPSPPVEPRVRSLSSTRRPRAEAGPGLSQVFTAEGAARLRSGGRSQGTRRWVAAWAARSRSKQLNTVRSEGAYSLVRDASAL